MTSPRLLIAIPTFRRTELLPPLLAEIATQTSASPLAERVRIAVVDNDPERSAEPVTAGHAAAYFAEATPGIAAVRQRALDEAQEGELVIMVDDDVFPEEGWLDALVDTWERTRATAVLGYVRYVWPEGTDPWITAGGFLRRTPHPTGTPLRAFVTGNVLIDADAVRAMSVRFDVSLGLSGGEDSLFGDDVLAAGGSLVAAAESVCRDDVPPARTTRAFVRQRTVNHGVLHTRFALRGHTGIGLFLRRIAALGGGGVRWTAFTAQHLWGRARGDLTRDATGQRRAWFAIGRMAGALGSRRAEYGRS